MDTGHGNEIAFSPSIGGSTRSFFKLIYTDDPSTDYDNDGLPNELEVETHGTDPFNPDTDADSLPDGWEVTYDLNPLLQDDHLDPDDDGETNREEHDGSSNPRVQDITGYQFFSMLSSVEASYSGGLSQGQDPNLKAGMPRSYTLSEFSYRPLFVPFLGTIDWPRELFSGDRPGVPVYASLHSTPTSSTPRELSRLYRNHEQSFSVTAKAAARPADVEGGAIIYSRRVWLRAPARPTTWSVPYQIERSGYRDRLAGLNNAAVPLMDQFVVYGPTSTVGTFQFAARAIWSESVVITAQLDTFSPQELIRPEGGGSSSGETSSSVLTLIPIDIAEVISDQIAGNECNKLPTPFFRNAGGTGGPNNPMLMATRTGRVAHLAVKMNVTAAFASKIYVGVREVGTTSILGSTVSVAAPGKTLLQFTANTGHKIYEVVAGYDANANSTLENSEVATIFEKTPKRDSTGAAVTANLNTLDKIVIVEQGQFVDSKNFLTGGGDLPFSDYAGDLIEAFGEGATTVPDATTTPGIVVRSTHPSLTHQVGAKWNAACEDTTHRLDFADGTEPSDDFEASNARKTIVDTVIQENIAALITHGTGKPGWPVLTLPGFNKLNSFRVSEGPGVGFGGINELHLAFGSVTITGTLQVSFRVLNPTTIEVGSISVSGSFEDLYDFDYWSGSLPQSAAIVQAGHASLSTAANPSGKLFYTRLNYATGWIALNKNFIK